MKAYRMLILLGGCLLASSPAAAREPVTTDFFDGIPADFTLEDRDGNILSQDVMKYGFSQGDAWVAYFIESEKNMVAASTSWYASPGTSDDWMILPKMRIGDGDALRWRARSADKYMPNAYKVVAECEGNETVLFSTGGESPEWTFRHVSLDAFAGKEIAVAFVDCSTDASLLYVDDIRLGHAEKVRTEITVPSHITELQPFDLTGTIETDMADTVKGRITVVAHINGKELPLDLGDTGIQPGTAIPFSFPKAAEAGTAGEPFTVKVEIQLDGIAVAESEKALFPVPNYAVCEELTGTWCAWCVRGMATFERLDRLYPRSFIGIAIHYQDAMSRGVEDYSSWIYSYGHATGLPFGFMMRNSSYGSDFDKFQEAVAQINALPLTAFVETSVGEPSGNEYPLTTKVTLSETMTDDRYQIAYTLVENDVFDPEHPDSYTQKNAYAGGERGECGGYENKPELMEDVHFQHVARTYTGDYKGIFGSLPMYMKKDTEYVSENTMEVPARVLDKAKCEVVTLLIDKKTSCIVAADKLPLIGGRAGIRTPEASEGLSVGNGWLNVPAGSLQVSVTDIAGRTLFKSSGDAPVDLSCLGKGIYVIRVTTRNGATSRTFSL